MNRAALKRMGRARSQPGCGGRRRPPRRRLLAQGLPAAALTAALAFAGGCRTPHVPCAAAAAHGLPATVAQPAATNMLVPGRMMLAQVVAGSLNHNPRLWELADAVRQAAGEQATIRLESPELRLGRERGRGRRSGHLEESEHGAGAQSSVEDSSGSSTRYGVPEETRTARQAASSRSTVAQQTESAESAREAAEGLSVSLRVRPPHPWEWRAELRLADAEKAFAEGELQAEQHQLACDIVEAAVRIAHLQALTPHACRLAARAGELAAAAAEAARQGALPPDDAATAGRLAASAQLDADRHALALADAAAEFRTLAGVDPDRVALSWLTNGGLCQLTFPAAAGQTATGLAAVASQRLDVVLADWRLRRAEQAWRMARARRIPWLSHVAAGYAWSEEEQSGTRWSETRETKDTDSAWQSVSRESDAWSTRVDTRDAVERETATGERQAIRHAYEDADSREWWVEVGLDVPLFEWLSPEVRVRRQGLEEARSRLHDYAAQALRELQQAAAGLEQAIAIRERSRATHAERTATLEALAEAQRARGLRGSCEALRLEETQQAWRRHATDAAMRVGLAEVNLCRAAGVWPRLASAEPADGAYPHAHQDPARGAP